MKQASTYLPTYAADNSAMCSALYELDGLLVMHDASGCNSTYTTHDEPRWYDHPANVFITGLTEMDAVLGNEKRAIDDIAAACSELHPRFVALAGTPIPMMMGCDYAGLAREIEEKTGVMSLGVDTNGTDDYVAGIGKSFVELARRICPETQAAPAAIAGSVNILGATPLDLSINGTNESYERLLVDSGFTVLSNWAMGEHATLENMAQAPHAAVNWVVTTGGIPVAQYFYQVFGTPFVIAAPIGRFMAEMVTHKLHEAIENQVNINLAVDCRGNFEKSEAAHIVIVGEAVTSAAIRASLVKDFGLRRCCVCTPLTAPDFVLGVHDRKGMTEDDFRKFLPLARQCIADPFYAHFLRSLNPHTSVECVDLPHEALSGRIWREAMPQLTGSSFLTWYADRKKRRALL